MPPAGAAAFLPAAPACSPTGSACLRARSPTRTARPTRPRPSSNSRASCATSPSTSAGLRAEPIGRILRRGRGYQARRDGFDHGGVSDTKAACPAAPTQPGSPAGHRRGPARRRAPDRACRPDRTTRGPRGPRADARARHRGRRPASALQQRGAGVPPRGDSGPAHAAAPDRAAARRRPCLAGRPRRGARAPRGRRRAAVRAAPSGGAAAPGPRRPARARSRPRGRAAGAAGPLAEAHLAVRAGAVLGSLDEVQPLGGGAEQARDQPQAGVLGAEVEQALLGLEAELDSGRHLVGAHPGELLLVRAPVGGALHELRVGRARLVGRGGVERLGAIGQELDLASGVGQVLVALDEAERARAAGDDVHAAVLGLLEHFGDFACAADRAQALVGEPDDPELAPGLQALADHRLVAVLEDVQGDELGRERDDAQGEEREVPRGLSGAHPRCSVGAPRRWVRLSAMSTVAFLGTGIMGFPMARHIAAAGIEVRAWNRTRTKVEPLAADGVTVAESPAQAAEGADVLVTMLADADAVAASVAGVRDVPVWAQMSTVGIEPTVRLHALADEHGMVYVDAPVLGTKKPAEDAQLVVLAAGPPEVRERLAPIFDAMARETRWLD